MVSISLKGSSIKDLEVPDGAVNTSQVFTISLSITENTYKACSIKTYIELQSTTYAELSGYYSWSDYADESWVDVSSYTW